MENDYPMLTVICAACVGMVAVMIFGQAWQKFVIGQRVQYVECSITIQDMARKLNVTLLDMCVLER